MKKPALETRISKPARSVPTSDPQIPEFAPFALSLAKAAIDKRAERVKILDISEVSGIADAFIICSGRSDRQVQAIANSVEEIAKLEGKRPLTMEGYSEGRWVLIDFGYLVVHVFLDELREYYDLDSIWSDAPVVRIPAEYLGPGGSHFTPS